MIDINKIPKSLTKPLITHNLALKLPPGVNPNGAFVDVPKAMAAAANPQPGDNSDFDLRLLTHLLRRQFSKLDPAAIGDPQEYVRQMRIGLDPRDKIEEVLAGSILLTYARLAQLSHNASLAADQFDLLPIFAAAEQTAGSLRRQLQLFAKYRATKNGDPLPAPGRAEQPILPNPMTGEKNEKSANEIGLSGTKQKRPYTLTSEGRRSLNAAIRKNQPWKRTTGPKTPVGKKLASLNAFKHGARSRQSFRLPATTKGKK
jgi:hypothetical protein